MLEHGSISFFMAKWYSVAWMDRIVFTPSSAVWHLGVRLTFYRHGTRCLSDGPSFWSVHQGIRADRLSMCTL